MEPYPRFNKPSNPEPKRSVAAILRKAAELALDRSVTGFGLRIPFDHRTAVALAAAGAKVVIDHDEGVAGVTIPESGQTSFLDSIDFDAAREEEVSFRRGFAHGAHYAVGAMNSGATRDQLQDWLGRIHSWRQHRSEFALPPDVFQQPGGAK